MAAVTTSGLSIQASHQAVQSGSLRPNRRRRITPEAGHALEKLAHAIEYLTDEFVHEDRALNVGNAPLQAVQMLMALNRQVYFECPELPTFGERCRAMLHLHAA